MYCILPHIHMSGLLVSWTTTSAASTAAAAEAEGDAAEEQLQHALRAAVEDARADEEWRQLLQQQARREEEAEEEALRERLARRGTTRAPVPAPAPATVKSVRHDDEPDGQGWTPLEQRALEAAMRAHPACAGVAPADRWRGIAALVPGRSARECVQRCRTLAAAVRASALAPAPSVAPPIPSAALLRLDGDVLFGVLARVDGRALCACACACRELGAAAHDDALWLPIADALPSKWAYSRRDRGGEAVWSYCLRMRTGLYGAWRKLNLHRAGECPYLRKLGTVDRGTFVPAGALDYKLAYGAVCELVQLESKREVRAPPPPTSVGMMEPIGSNAASGTQRVPTRECGAPAESATKPQAKQPLPYPCVHRLPACDTRAPPGRAG